MIATLTSIQLRKKTPKQPVQDVWTSCETPSPSLMLLSRYSQPFLSWLPFGNGGIWQLENHLCVKQIYYYLTRKCKTLPPTIWKCDHHKLWGRPFPGISLEMPVFSQIFKLKNTQKNWRGQTPPPPHPPFLALPVFSATLPQIISLVLNRKSCRDSWPESTGAGMQKELSWRESSGSKNAESAPYQPAPGHCTLLKNTSRSWADWVN